MRNALPTIAGAFVLSATLTAHPLVQAGQTPYPGGTKGQQARPPVGQGDGEHASTGSTDADFMKKAANAGQAEMELADVANQQSPSASVKALASKIKSDHTEAASELKRLAETKHVVLPSSLMADQQAVRDRIRKLSGAAFDRTYVDQMVADHREAVDFFTKASHSGDTEVAAFASKTLPALKDHLQRSEALQKSMGGGDRP